MAKLSEDEALAICKARYWDRISNGTHWMVGPRHDAPTGEFWVEAWGHGVTFEEATENALEHENPDLPQDAA